MREFHSLSISNTLKETDSSVDGLTCEEASSRLVKFGYNQLDMGKKRPMIFKLLSQFKDLMILILLIASAISIAIGIVEGTSSEIIDGGIILGIVVVNALLGFLQEAKAERSMEALKRLTEPEAFVIRGGERMKISTNKLVVGDIVILEAGVIVPADLRLIETASLKCDEASLTGESHAVEKVADIVCKKEAPLGDRKNIAFSGSVIVSGRGVGVVVATGKKSEIGKIAEIISSTEKDDTPLQKGLRAIGKVVTVIVLFVAALVFVLEVIARPTEPIIEAFLTAVAIAVAAIPESMPAVITIIMSMGVARLAKQKAIIKRLHAVETLGSCEVICSDKTGTITQNVMTVKGTYVSGRLMFDNYDIKNPDFLSLVIAGTLCNDSKKSKGKYVGDPTETALCEFAELFKLEKKKLEIEHIRVDELPFDSVRKLMSTIHESEGQSKAYVKGAVDMMLHKCSKIMINGKIRVITDEDIKGIEKANLAMGSRALRVLGVAFKELSRSEVKKFEENNLIFIGLIGMIDPPRKEVFAAVEKCKQAGMRPIMITGDHKDTAFAIAKEVGICSSAKEIMTGVELDRLSNEMFLERLKTVSVFARVSPENKVRIVEALKKQGKIVAMTGDGVNDAPSMKMASIGVGMGITGTDVTKEVADMIVTDDNFATIVVAVEEGRKIYDNIQKTVRYLFAANLAEILSLLFATLIFPEFIFLFPVQILFVNLITDSLPAIALGLEPAEKSIMNKPPRKTKSSLFGGGVGYSIVILGLMQTFIVFGSYMIGLRESPEIATTMAFFSLNLVQILFIYSTRVKGSIFKCNPLENKWVSFAVLAAFGVLASIAFTPIHSILNIVQISPLNWLIVLVMAFSIIIWSELFKLAQLMRDKRISTKENEGSER